jgi:BirA family biotin operon repressor/biotin-[acetyl-CoA-carboxylase] ligase
MQTRLVFRTRRSKTADLLFLDFCFEREVLQDFALFFMDYDDLHLKSTESTNLVARQRGCAGAVHGSGVAADTQTSGRGRLGRAWFSPAGTSLYCSYVVRPSVDVDHFPKLTMAAGVAVAQSLRLISGIGIGLKWPNDLYIGARKCGGILCEFATDSRQQPFAVVGVGINCNLVESDFPAELRVIATSLLIESGASVDIKQLFQQLRRRILQMIEVFEQGRFDEILESWNQLDIFRGSIMSWRCPDGTILQGENLGTDREGALMVRDADAKIHRIFSGEVTSAGALTR